MKLNIRKRLVALITSGAVAFTLVGCSSSKKENDSDSLFINEIISSKSGNKEIENISTTIYDAYFNGDFSIEKLSKYFLEKNELPEQIKYTNQLEHLKTFSSDYTAYIDAYEDGNKELCSIVLEKLQTSELFNIEQYIDYFPYLKSQETICTDNEIYTVDNEFLLRKGGLSIKDNYSSNLFTYIHRYNVIDKSDEESWAELFSNLIYVLSIDPSEYNFDSAPCLTLAQYDFIDDDAQLVDTLAYTNDNIQSINDYVLNKMKDKIIDKDTDNIILEYSEKENDWKVIYIDEYGNSKSIKSISEYINDYDYKTKSELELISNINKMLLKGDSKQALSELNVLFSQLSLDTYFSSSNYENDAKCK